MAVALRKFSVSCKLINGIAKSRLHGSCVRKLSQTTHGADSQEQTESEFHKTDTDQTYEDTDEREYDTKLRILKSSLPFVHEHGWTQNAIIAGAESEGLPGVAHGLFPRGGVELVFYFYNDCNKRLAEELAEKVKQEEAEQNTDPSVPKIRPFIRGAIETRLRMIIPYIDKWPQAMGIMALPPNAPEALSNLLNLTDEIWYYAGDRSTDFNWYTKRTALGAIYKATEVYMVQDQSEDFYQTWDFLDRRIEDIGRVSNVAKRTRESNAVMMEACKGLGIMARNIAGMNYRRK